MHCMTDIKTHTGSCHCGAVRYEVATDLASVIACNCSMCGRAGTLLAFVTADKFKLLSGEDALTDYQFNKHVIHHTFCKVCGIKPFAKGKDRQGNETRAINVRCLEGVDIDKLNVHQYDGKNH
jgi:hypothetical protein